MSSFRDTITTTHARLRDAATRGDKEAAIKILEEYWQTIQAATSDAPALKAMLAAAAAGDSTQPLQLLLTAAALHPDPSFLDEIAALALAHPALAPVAADIVRQILALQTSPPTTTD